MPGCDIPGKLLLIALAALPLVLPSFVGAYALLLLLGRSGVVTQALNAWGIPFGSIYGTPGIVAVYTLTLYPYVLLPTVAGLKAVDVSVEEAAQSLGSSPARTFRTVTLPIVIPSVLSGALLVLIETLENFGVPAVLAEDMPILSVEAYKLFIGETATNPSAAGVLGVLLIALDLDGADHPAALSGEPALCDRRPRRSAADQDRHRLAHRWRRPTAGRVVLLALVPFFAIVVLSFMEFRGPVLHAAFSLRNYAELFATAGGPLANTLLFATLAAGAAAFIGVPIGWVLVRTRSGWTSLLDVVGHPAVRRRRNGARHRPRDRLQRRRAGADGRMADHGARLHRAQAALHGARIERHPASDRSVAGGGLHQPRRLAAAHAARPRSCR